MDFKELVAALKGLQGRTVISFHSAADLDAVASALVLRDLVKNAEVRAADRENAQARKVLQELALEVKSFSEEELDCLDRYKNIVFVDVSTPTLLGPLREKLKRFKGRVLAIDHHTHNAEMNAKVYLDEDKTSTCEIIFELARALKRRPTKTQAMLLAAGVVSDTAGLKSANSYTVFALNELLGEAGADLQKVYELAEARQTVSERMARIAAVKKAKVERVIDVLIASSQSPAFELQCASALIEAGADFAVVENAGEGRLSAVKNGHPRLGKLNVGALLKQLGAEFAGSGGGHELVGGASIPSNSIKKAVEKCMRTAKGMIEA